MQGRVAIITGAGSGLGASYAHAISSAGAAVMVADINDDWADGVAQELNKSGGKALGYQLDVADEAAVQDMVRRTSESFGRLDILVNNAGWRPWPAGDHYEFSATPDQRSPTPGDLGAKEWVRILTVNIVGPLICARACRPYMAAGGGGTIINQSSNAAYSGGGPYGVSKLGLNGLTMHLAAEYADDHIRVNGIAPGMMTSRMPSEEAIRSIVQKQVIQRQGRPQDLLGALMFLCSDESSFITGQTLLVDGGQVRRI